MVRVAGIEPARPKPRDFKSLVSTYFTTLAINVGPPTRNRTWNNSLEGYWYIRLPIGRYLERGTRIELV